MPLELINIVPPPSGSMSVSVIDTGAGHTSQRVIDEDEPFDVSITWDLDSMHGLIGGEFRLRVFAESMGNGQEQQIGQEAVVAANPGGPSPYTHTITMPPGTLRGEGATGGQTESGVYRLVAVLQHRYAPDHYTDISGFAESGLIQVRRP